VLGDAEVERTLDNTFQVARLNEVPDDRLGARLGQRAHLGDGLVRRVRLIVLVGVVPDRHQDDPVGRVDRLGKREDRGHRLKAHARFLIDVTSSLGPSGGSRRTAYAHEPQYTARPGIGTSHTEQRRCNDAYPRRSVVLRPPQIPS
jgi:hypothetical protein